MRDNIKKDRNNHYYGVQVVAFGVLINGIWLITGTLISQLIRHNFKSSSYNVATYLLIGISLIYLANLLWRRKYTAWIFTLLVYAFYILLNINRINHRFIIHLNLFILIRDFLLPFMAVGALILTRKAFNVRSDIRSFGFSLRIIFIVLIITLSYGVAGFQLMDNKDFHQEMSLSNSIHRTVDQFGLTTENDLIPYTNRARVFLDSLNIISIAAIFYILISLFQPLKARYKDQTDNIAKVTEMLGSSHNSSEDFFKIWPHDKYYYFNKNGTSGVAYTVHKRIALIVGDPFGAVSEFKDLIIEFTEYCRLNDWIPSFIHTEPHFNPMYKRLDFISQKIGEEAIVDVDNFLENVVNNKYFRNINNKFKKQKYSCEILKPPHSNAIVDRLSEISKDWLSLPGRTERSFMMGYFNESYLQKCNLIIVRDEASTIQGFLNQIPSFDKEEANFDMLRHSKNALGNINDYIMMNFISQAKNDGFKRVNMGLCPLVGLDKTEKDRTIIDRSLSFLYSNGDRFYSFSGLYRFKQKYEPKWSNRYIVYKGGIRTFTRTINALNVAMKPHRFQKNK